MQTGEYLRYEAVYHIVKKNENYKLLLSSSSQQTMKVIDRSFKSYFSSLNSKKNKKNKNKKVNKPKYLKKDGKFVVIIPKTGFRVKDSKLFIGLSKKFREEHQIKEKDLILEIPNHLKSLYPDNFLEIRIVPRYGGMYYQIEFVYNLKSKKVKLDYTQFLSNDLGLDNFATYVDTYGTANIICGKYIKSLNQWSNKENARLQSVKDKQGIKGLTTKQVNLWRDREHKINEFLNLAVHQIIKHSIEKKIGNIVVGKFKDIKQNINLGKTTNQNFVFIPYAKFRQKLKAKCKLYKINYYEQEESYTSKCDALALEPIRKRKRYLGKRIKRGLFQSSVGRLINADINGALNILRKFLYRKKKKLGLTKVAIDSLIREIDSRGLVNRPRKIRLGYHISKQTSPKLNWNSETLTKTSALLKTLV